MGTANSMKILVLGDAIAIMGCLAIASSGDYALGQITSDNSLGAESSQVTSPTPGTFLIEQGATRGTNLFHSFSQFSVPTNGNANFNNQLNIQNIITRVTGGSISNIDGSIRAKGRANLFLLNPNGIIFGPNASLNIGGSFIGSTANAVNFADGIQFSATGDQTTPLLTVSLPIGLQYGANPGRIVVQGENQPTNISLNSASLRTQLGASDFKDQLLEIITNRNNGLKVKPSETLALVGGDVVLRGGGLITGGGRIELGSVGDFSVVSLTPVDKGWKLGYEGVQHFENIQLSSAATIKASALGGGEIQIRGGQITLTDQSIIVAITGNQDGGDVSIGADQLTFAPGSILSTGTAGAGKSGDITIETKDLTIQGAIVQSGTAGSGNAGNIIVLAKDSVSVVEQGLLITGTLSSGNGGNLTLKTGRLIIKDGSVVSTGTFDSGNGGNLVVQAHKSVEVSGTDANGEVSLLSSETKGIGNSGDLTINTDQLMIRGGKVCAVSEDSGQAGQAGQIRVIAHSIHLDQGRITAKSRTVNGGNITLQTQNLILRDHSDIVASAGDSFSGGDGGNISIDTDFIVAVPSENNDIIANAFTGKGGKVTINAQSIFGMVPHSREDLVRLIGTNDPTQLNSRQLPTNDITAISQTNPTLSGAVTINTLDVDPSRGLAKLPVEPVNAEVTQGCQSAGKQTSVAFFNTGRGGLAPNPYEPISSSDIWEDVPPSTQRVENSASAARASTSPAPPSEKLMEAQGWIINEQGKVTLVAEMPATRSQGRCRLR